MVLLGGVAAIVIASALGFSNIGAIAAGRLSSSFDTEYDTASLSNFVRPRNI
jgi:hypothetical protein